MKFLTFLSIILTIFLVACVPSSPSQADDVFIPESIEDDDLQKFIPLEAEIQYLVDGTPYLVNPNKIRGGGPPKDGIPSIDDPKFESAQSANFWIDRNELVMAIDYKGVKRVYPFQIMVWHEIVNDFIAGDPILITYCPLCGSGIAFERTLNGEVVEFGTSGKLFNSNLVMYDRKTDTYWSQIDGLAIFGELTGTVLTPVSIDVVSWGEWFDANPDSEVLTRTTGYSRPYGTDPYGNYYTDSFLIAPVENEDDIVHPKTVIFGINVDGNFAAYRENDLKVLGTLDDVVGGVNVRVERLEGGIVKVTNLDTGEEIVKERDFWFAWYAFHPTTSLYEP